MNGSRLRHTREAKLTAKLLPMARTHRPAHRQVSNARSAMPGQRWQVSNARSAMPGQRCPPIHACLWVSSHGRVLGALPTPPPPPLPAPSAPFPRQAPPQVAAPPPRARHGGRADGCVPSESEARGPEGGGTRARGRGRGRARGRLEEEEGGCGRAFWLKDT